MSKRYLSKREIISALNRGKTVEIFLGGFSLGEIACIRWVSFNKSDGEITGKIWEALDEGSVDYLDVYSFSPVSGEWDTPIAISSAQSIDAVVEELGIEQHNFVNSGVIQDEYASYKGAVI